MFSEKQVEELLCLKKLLDNINWLNEDNPSANQAMLHGLIIGFTGYHSEKVIPYLMGEPWFYNSSQKLKCLPQISQMKPWPTNASLLSWQSGEIFTSTRSIGSLCSLCNQISYGMYNNLGSAGDKLPMPYLACQSFSGSHPLKPNYSYAQNCKSPSGFMQEFPRSYANGFQYYCSDTMQKFYANQFLPVNSAQSNYFCNNNGSDYFAFTNNHSSANKEKEKLFPQGNDCSLDARPPTKDKALPDIKSYETFPSLPEPLLDTK